MNGRSVDSIGGVTVHSNLIYCEYESLEKVLTSSIDDNVAAECKFLATHLIVGFRITTDRQKGACATMDGGGT